MIAFNNITQRYGAFTALSKVTFSGRAGSVHAITGENGAGKSTLMKLLSGVLKPSGGEILINEKTTLISDPNHARNLGIATVFQELTLLPNLTIAENLYLGREPIRFGLIDGRAMRKNASQVLQSIGLDLDVSLVCGRLSIGEQHLVEIAKSAVLKSNVIIYDEPTAALDSEGVAKLFSLIKKQKAAGKLIFYISHRMHEIFSVCDTVSVLKDGVHVRTCPTSTLNQDSLVSLMIGRELSSLYPPRTTTITGPVKLSVDQLVLEGAEASTSVEVLEGEIVGFAGLEGQGQRRLIRAIAGLEQMRSGTVQRHHEGVSETLKASIVDVVNAGIGFVPEDRKTEGLYLDLSIGQNVGLGSLRGKPLWSVAKRDPKQLTTLMSSMNIQARDVSQQVRSLSGGNQQKVMLGRWLNSGIDILLIEEPTRGVDVGAKAEIYRLLREFTTAGGAVLMTSSEMTEHLGLCDRILVVRSGTVVVSLRAEDASEESLARYALMGNTKKDAAA